MKTARHLAVPLTLAAALAVGACGTSDTGPIARGTASNEATQNTAFAESEGIYVDVDQLKYQVQISRLLNPLISEDEDYLEDVGAGDEDLGTDEEWFAIFIRVENGTDQAIPNATDFEIHDTQENVYRPVDIGPANNFAYRPADVQGKEVYPLPDSTPGERPPQGALLLFRLRRFSLDNRPLELVIHSRTTQQQATVELDV